MTSEIVNIAAHLPARAQEYPEQLAVAQPVPGGYRKWTYRQLNETSDIFARGLAASGLSRGMRTVLMVKPSLDFFGLTFALFKLGAVPVLVDPGMGVRNLGKCLAEAEPEAFIGIPRAHLARLLLGWAKRTLKINVTAGWRLGWGGLSLAQVHSRGLGSGPVLAPTRPDDTAAILFTSGSTGVPKGAVYTHGIFAAQVELLRTLFGIEPGEIDLCTFPLFALFAPALGMSAIVPEMDFTRPGRVDPVQIVQPLAALRVSNLFGSPALLRRVVTQRNEATPFQSLRRVLSAGAPVAANILREWRPLLPGGTQIFTPYGATEALPVACIGSAEILGETSHQTTQGAGTCVGRPVPGMEIAIIRIDDGPLPEWSDDLRLPQGQIGEITVRGPVVTREYVNRPDLTALAKIHDTRAGGVWHRMGDVGYFDRQGRLWFCGRKSQRVVTDQETLFPDQCEGVFNAHPAVHRTALVGTGVRGQQRPVLCVELLPGKRRAVRVITQELLALGAAQPLTRDITTLLFHPRFPVDIRHNSKIFREKLAVWAARQLR